jgi:glucosamine--fructose-6-phosphate aminotransferase (isomerizing)
MCGIMGYTGVLPATPIIIKGLEKLQYRGYDSAGIGLLNKNEIKVYKTVGSPEKLWDKVPENSPSRMGIGHTRWATHGAPTLTNAHPHTGPDGIFTIVHNGIIENYSDLKSDMESRGFLFKTDTDTEVVAYMLEEAYKGDVKSAISEVMPKLKGSYALGILCRDCPDMIFCAKLSSPLFVCTDRDGGYLASDVSVLPKTDESKIYKLGDNEIGILTKDSLKVFDVDGCRIRKTEIKIKKAEQDNEKNGYEHFMLKEIYQQPLS